MIEAILVIAVVALGFVVHTHKVVIDRYSDKVDDLEKRFNQLKEADDDIMKLILADRKKHELQAAIRELENTMPHTDGMRHYNTVKRRITGLKQQLEKL